MDITISPSTTVKNFCSAKPEGCGIQELNDTCFGVASAYSNNVNAWDVPQLYADDCNKLVNDARYAIYGVGKCDHQAPRRSLLIRNHPRRFVEYYRQLQDPTVALNTCINGCSTLQCQDECRLDASALSTRIESYAPILRENYTSSSYLQWLVALAIIIAVIYFVF